MRGKDGERVISRERENRKPKTTQAARKEGGSQRASASRVSGILMEDSPWQKRVILFAVALLSAIIISPRATISVYTYQPGDIARKNVKAPHDFLVEDTPSTLKKRGEAMAASLAVYDFDERASKEIGEKIGESFSMMRRYLNEIDSRARETIEKNAYEEGEAKESQALSEIVFAYMEESRAERRLAFEELLSVRVDEKVFDVLEGKGFYEGIEGVIGKAVLPVMEKGVVDSKELLSEEKEKGIIVRGVESKEEKTVTDVSAFFGLEEARIKVPADISSLMSGWGEGDIRAVSALAAALVRPNLTLNKNETEERKKDAADAINPVFFQVKEGEMILREGERVTEDHMLRLDALAKSSSDQVNILNIFGLFLLISAILYSLYHFSVQNIRKIVPDSRDLIFLGILLLATLAFFRFSIPVTEALKGVFPYIPTASYSYLFSAAAAAMLVRIVLNSETAIVFSVIVSLTVAMTVKESFVFSIYTFVGCIVGAHMVRYCRDRVTLIKAGFYVGIVNLLMVLIITMAYGSLLDGATPFSMLFALLGGVITGVLVTGLTPLTEWLFRYTTNFSLLELASLDHPLLKELITRAPGTYHHSWIIGNLVETAAEAINANPLLARVSALYHDIGKIKKPQYFYENQKGQKNPHDKLTPSLSSLIIIGHVKDGTDLAREHRLGRRITDIIPQHHGTRLITYFYNKAKEQEDPDVHFVDEKDFRYPGPKPQTKEAGLVMLADAVEAATRTLQEPTPARIKATVKRLIGEIFEDGQLEECELTLKDLNGIANSFVHILIGIYHARIDYPGPEKEEKVEGTDGVKKEGKRGKKVRGSKNGKEGSRPSQLH